MVISCKNNEFMRSFERAVLKLSIEILNQFMLICYEMTSITSRYFIGTNSYLSKV